MYAYWIPGNIRTCSLELVKWWELTTKGWFSILIPRKQDFTLRSVGWNPDDLNHICKRVTISLLFSPIKKLIVKAFVSNLQLTNRQLCTKGNSATQSNMPEGYSISTVCNYNTDSCPEYNLAENAIKLWILLWNRCGFAHLCCPLPSPVWPKRPCSRGMPRDAHCAGLHSWHQALTLGGAAGRCLPGSSTKHRKRANFLPPCSNTCTEAAGQAAKACGLLRLHSSQR